MSRLPVLALLGFAPVVMAAPVEAGPAEVVVSRVSARVAAVHVAPGDVVKKGDLLFTLEPTELTARRREAELEAELARLTSDAAFRNLGIIGQMSILGPPNSRAEYERARQLNEIAQKRRHAAEAALRLARAREAQATRVTAPFAGRVVRPLVKPGSAVDGGARGSPLVELQPLPSRSWFELDLP